MWGRPNATNIGFTGLVTGAALQRRYPLPPGVQADLDLGNYERFLDVTLTRDHNITTGKVYAQVRRPLAQVVPPSTARTIRAGSCCWECIAHTEDTTLATATQVIAAERRGDYLGKTVQVIGLH